MIKGEIKNVKEHGIKRGWKEISSKKVLKLIKGEPLRERTIKGERV